MALPPAVMQTELMPKVLLRARREKQAVPILKLPLPTPPPKGAEWIAAFRYWKRGGR